ncbi:competence type IV pilus minor pilin ComGG [Alkalicoccobacillus murimartini]|uniref:ComG operon protein 7 n=1 Tax=Alkalicoccobacillus murimartini TaxID=171685 RepID=A0ABT9YMD2_9BACI|nr:competence type IV pilus minor pilin ComGG [Alkalicoccobacillus murimartini]MDQ0209003.1 hypothetical protein [Alkalicoccobacillus murimartini]
MTKQNGFAYPLTLLIVAIITLSCLYAVELYEVEKRYVYEQEKLLQLDNLVQMAITDFLDQSEKTEGIEEKVYEVGSVVLTSKKQSDEVFSVDIRARVGDTHMRQARIRVHVPTDQLIHFQDMI